MGREKDVLVLRILSIYALRQYTSSGVRWIIRKGMCFARKMSARVARFGAGGRDALLPRDTRDRVWPAHQP